MATQPDIDDWAAESASEGGFAFGVLLGYLCHRGTPIEAARSQAAEAVSDATTAVVQRYPPAHFISRSHFDRTVAKAARNLAIGRWYRTKGDPSIGEYDPPDPRPAQNDDWTADCSGSFRVVFARLEPHDRLLMRIKFVEEWTLEQMAEIFLPDVPNLKTAIGRMHTRLRRLTRRLREMIETDQHGTASA